MSFKEFVMKQPAERTIDHTKGWYGCAVGDYAEEVQGLRKNVSFSDSNWRNNVKNIVQDDLLQGSLHNAGSYIKWSTKFECYVPVGTELAITNYGHLQDYYEGKLEIEVQSLI